MKMAESVIQLRRSCASPVVETAAAAVHADADLGLVEPAGKVIASELAALAGVEDLGRALIEAVEGLDLPAFKVNVKGPGSAQYPPHRRIALILPDN